MPRSQLHHLSSDNDARSQLHQHKLYIVYWLYVAGILVFGIVILIDSDVLLDRVVKLPRDQ